MISKLKLLMISHRMLLWLSPTTIDFLFDLQTLDHKNPPYQLDIVKILGISTIALKQSDKIQLNELINHVHIFLPKSPQKISIYVSYY
jgi:hypothetical protein